MVLRVAATLRLADHLGAGTGSVAALAAAAGADADALDRLLRHLAVIGVVARAADGTYSLTARGAPLRDGDDSGLRAVLDADGDIGRGDLAFVDLLHSIRTGEAAFPVRYGSSFWDDLATDAARNAAYDTQMGRDVAAWAPAVVDALDWSRVEHVVDVGGGDGTLLAALLHAHPRLRGTVLDQASTVAHARATLDAAGLADRGGVVAGSFFDPLPAGGDVFLLCAVLHDWDDASAQRILRRCAEAAGGAGRVVVVEKTGPEGGAPSTVMDLRVLVYFGARERDVDQLVALGAAAGLARRSLHRAGDISVLELGA